MRSSVAEWFGHPVVGAECVELFLASMPPELAEGGAEEQTGLLQMIGSMPMHRFVADFGADMAQEQLDRLAMEAGAARG
jgi:beta-glucosidase